MRKEYFIIGCLLLALLLILVVYHSEGSSVQTSPEIPLSKTSLNTSSVIIDNPSLVITEISDCQDIVTSGKYVLTQDVLAGPTCFTITADNVLFDGEGYSILGNKEVGDYGIHILKTKNVVIQNTSIKDFERGIFLDRAINITLRNNKLFYNLEGIYTSYGSDNIRITRNTFSSSGDYALFLSGENTSVIANTFEENFKIVVSRVPNALASNLFMKNVNTFSRIKRGSKNLLQGENSMFNISFFTYNESLCDECKISLEIFPTEPISILSKQNGLLQGTFTPTQEGIYSLRVISNDTRNNSEMIKYIYLVNATKADTANYYLRGKDPTHGQALSWGGLKADSGSLLFKSPASFETRTCSDWIQVSPDELPEYLFGIVKEINFSLSYTAQNPAMVGVQRFASYDQEMDRGQEIPSAVVQNTKSFNFSVDWPINYYWEWYWLAIKLSSPGGYSTLLISPKNPDKAQITYLYSDTPAITKITNKAITFLSATMKDGSGSATIILEGKGITEMDVKMPNTTQHYRVLYDGVSCDINQDCLITHQSQGMIELLLHARSRHTITIAPLTNHLVPEHA